MTLGGLREKLKRIDPRLDVKRRDKDLACIYYRDNGPLSPVKVGDITYLIPGDEFIMTIPAQWIPASRQEARDKHYGIMVGKTWTPHKGWKDIERQLRLRRLM